MATLSWLAPFTHIWYFKCLPSPAGLPCLDWREDLAKVIYFAAYMITPGGESRPTCRMPSL